MPRQEIFLREAANGVEVEVIKTYDRSYAHEVYQGMGSDALEALSTTLNLAQKYEASEIPAPHDDDYEEFIWEEICDGSVEDVRQSPTLSSFFVVVETNAGKLQELYVSPDWPSAEAFAKRRLARA
jgi:hypothetical protein